MMPENTTTKWSALPRKRGGRPVCVAVVLALVFVLVPFVAMAEPAANPADDEWGIDAADELQFVPDAFSHSDAIGAVGRSVSAMNAEYVELDRLDDGLFGEVLQVWDAADPLLFHIAVGIGLPLYSGIDSPASDSEPLVGSLVFGGWEYEVSDDAMDAGLERQLRISRAIESSTPADPVMVQVLNIEF